MALRGRVMGDAAGRPSQAPVAPPLPAAAVVNTPAGGIAATDVQGALNELDTEKVAGSGTPGKLPKWTGPAVQGDSIITESGGKIGVNEPAPEAALHVTSPVGTTAPVAFECIGGVAQVRLKRANGAVGALTAVAVNDAIGTIAGFGYDGAGYFNRSAIRQVAAENWTNVAQGVYIAFLTTAIGTATAVERVRITDDGRVTLNSGPQIITGAGSPEGVVTAVVGSLFLRTDGGVGTTLYVKQTGTGNTGWGAK